MTHFWVLPQAEKLVVGRMGGGVVVGRWRRGRPSQGSLFVNPSVPANKVFQFQTHNKATQRGTTEDGIKKKKVEEALTLNE